MPRRNNNYDGQRSTRWPSPWLFLALAAFLAVGVRQTFYPAAKKVEVSKPEKFLLAIRPAEYIPATVKTGYQHPVVIFGTGSPFSDQLAKLIQDLQAETDSNQREELIANFLATLKPEDVSAVLKLLKDTGTSALVGDLSEQLVQRWGKSSPAGLAAWINTLPAGQQRQTAVEGLAITWANSQLTNAIIWGQSLRDEAERNHALVTVGNEAVRTDPMASLEIAADLPTSPERDELVRHAAMEWAAKDADDAIAWAEQIPDETLRATVLANEATAWADQDPESAANLAVDELPAGRLQENTVVAIVERWAQQQPEAVAAWVEQFPKGPLRASAIENLMAQWSQKAPAEAQAWLAKHS